MAESSRKRVGYLESMVKKVMEEFGAPLRVHDWAQKWCCQVHNVLALKSKRWRTPMELSTGNTPDISFFRFHFWEPVWYFDHSKAPESPWCKGRWLGIAQTSGDIMTYIIEKEDKPRSIIIRSGVRTHRQGIDTNHEHHRESQKGMILDEPETTPLNEKQPLPPLYTTDTDTNLVSTYSDSGEHIDCTNDVQNDPDVDMNATLELLHITGYEFINGILTFDTAFRSQEGDVQLRIPFSILKRTIPI